MADLDLPDEGLENQLPGVVFIHSEADHPFDPDRDKDLLDAKIETKIGEEKIKCIEFSEDRMQAYVELIEKADIEKLLASAISLRKGHPPLMSELIDLMDVRKSYLIVKGLEDWIESDLIKEHFVAEANGECVESVDIVEAGTAVVKFAHPKVALKFKSMTEIEFLGSIVELEVAHVIPSSIVKEEEVALSVSNLPLKIPPTRLKVSLEKYFLKHTGKKTTNCSIVDGIGYLTFDDSADVYSIVANPPKVSFFARSCLSLSTVPLSEVKVAENDSSTPLSPNAAPFSPSSSINSSMYGASNYSRNTSMESTTSGISVPNISDPNLPFNRYGSRQRNSSSNSSSEVHFEVGGILPSQDSGQLASLPIHMATASVPGHSQEGPLFTLQEHRPTSGSSPRVPISSEQLHIQDVEYSSMHNKEWQQFTPSFSKVHFEVGGNVASHGSSQLASLPAHMASTPSRGHQHNFPDLPEHFPVTQISGSEVPNPSVLHIQDVDVPGGQTPSSARMDTKILVDDVPPLKRDEVYIRSYLSDLMNVSCSVKKYGKRFLASFNPPIDFEVLKEKASKMSMGSFSFSFYKVNSTKTILVANLKDNITDRYLQLHFEVYTGKNSVQNVKMLPPNRALVTFLSPNHVEIAMCSTRCWEVEDVNITMTEYYDFMSYDEEDGGNPSPSATSKHSHAWDEVQVEVKPLEAKWLQCTLQGLNDKLMPLKARCSVSDGLSSGSPPYLTVTPQDGSEATENWDGEVKRIVAETRSHFVEISLPFPSSLQTEIVSHAQEETGPDLHVRCSDGVLVIGGHDNFVNQLESDLKNFIKEVQVLLEEKRFLKKYIRFLSTFSKHKLNVDGVEHYYLLEDEGKISVKGKLKGIQFFWEAVDSEVKQVQEKSVSLSHELFELLASKRGIKKTEELIGMASSTVMYYLVDDLNCSICFLSPVHADKCTLKKIKDIFKTFFDSQSLDVSPEKLRLCKDIKWREHVEKLEKEAFVSIVVDQSSSSVRVTGEKIIVGDIYEKIETFLLEKCSVEEHLTIGYHEWKVISSNFKHKMDAIERDFGKHTKIFWPKKMGGPVTITLRGEPNAVDDAKAKLEALQKEVCHKEEILSNIPAAIQLIDSMEDKIRLLESTHSASIDVSLVNDDSSSQPVSATLSSSLHPHKLCGATLSNEIRVSLYSGEFTKHGHVDAIINFVQLCPDNSDSNLKQLFATAGGSALQKEFKTKVDTTVHINPGFIIKMSDIGQLKCNQLLHSFLPCWTGGKDDEEYYLGQCLNNILYEMNNSNSILLASVCSKPLNYPAGVFAKKLISSLSSSKNVSSDLTVAIYVTDISEATEFDTYFKDPNSHCRLTIPVSTTQLPYPTASRGRVISNPIDSFITLLQGDLLKQKADVYVNSTNTNLDLKTGILSNVLLKACGEDLQKECSQHAPLKTGEVAVTGAKNLLCDSIYHVALPDCSDLRANRKFRTTVQAILRTAKEKNAKFVAIPSLGVGNLHFSAHTSAEIIYDEIICFSHRNPGSVMKYLLVIYDQKAFDEFSKVHAQKMNSAPAIKQESVTGSGSRSTKLSIENSDISDEDCDIIVNTTTENMGLSDSAVSKALLKKAGPNLQHACDQLVQDGFKLDHGQIVVTKSYGNLTCQKLIHAHVPPRADAVKSSLDHFALIHDIVGKCLNKAEKLRMKSVSFPAFGFGQGGYSVDEVACPMLTALQEFGKTCPKSVDTIRIVIYDQALHKEFSDFFLDFFKLDAAQPYRFIYSIASKITGRNQSRFVELQDSGAMNSSPPLHSFNRHFQNKPSSMLVFGIYAPTLPVCDQIVSQLRKLTKEKSRNDSIENPIIGSLIDTDIKEIMKIGEKFQVNIDIMIEINKILIQGERLVVAEARLKVMEILNDIEKAHHELQQFEWRSYGDDDDETYSCEDSRMLERAYVNNLPAIELEIDNVAVIIDLQKMQERSKLTGKVRTLKREKIKPSINLPDTWEPQPEVDGKPVPVHRFEVLQGSQEYQDTLKRFNETIGSLSVTVVKLERIQNPSEYSIHIALKDNISRKHSHKKIEVKKLFHGAKEDSIGAIITQGFNRNFAATANAAYYGCGVYFALNASYSAHPQYSVPNKEGIQFMFICSVIIGEYTVGTKNMRVPPPLQEGSSQVYDTLVENKDKPTIFVAVTDAQAYPEYLVSFKHEKKKVTGADCMTDIYCFCTIVICTENCIAIISLVISLVSKSFAIITIGIINCCGLYILCLVCFHFFLALCIISKTIVISFELKIKNIIYCLYIAT